jgi:hypothetical protein
MKPMKLFLFLSSAAIFLAACDVTNDGMSETEPDEALGARNWQQEFAMPVRVTEHRDDDDLVSAGLGLSGLDGPGTGDDRFRNPRHQPNCVDSPFTKTGAASVRCHRLPAWVVCSNRCRSVPGREFHAFLHLAECQSAISRGRAVARRV